MPFSALTEDASREVGFRHEAVLYDGAEFAEVFSPFVHDGLSAGETVVVAVTAANTTRLRQALGADAARVTFVAVEEAGRNPARIIPFWRELVARHRGGGRQVRGVGETLWAGRGPAEVVECHHHEAFLNLAFAASPLWLLCPYDIAALGPGVVADVERTHPLLRRGEQCWDSARYGGLGSLRSLFGEALPEPPWRLVEELTFGAGPLTVLRRVVSEAAATAGLSPERRSDLVVAANEVATNSLRHGGGGRLRMWSAPERFICEISDRGSIDQPLVGRLRPAGDVTGGRGLWLANHLCDLVQVRSSSAGTVVRLHMTTF